MDRHFNRQISGITNKTIEKLVQDLKDEAEMQNSNTPLNNKSLFGESIKFREMEDSAISSDSSQDDITFSNRIGPRMPRVSVLEASKETKKPYNEDCRKGELCEDVGMHLADPRKSNPKYMK